MIRASALIVFALLGTTSLRAAELTAGLGADANTRYEQLLQRIDTLKADTRLASKLELAKLYAAGIPAGPGNPISKPDTASADALLSEIIAGADANLRQQALALRATILQRSPIVADIDAGKAIDLQLAAETYAPALARIINAGGTLPPGLDASVATQSLNQAVLKGDSAAAFALSKLLATSDPERSKILASQALILLSAEAGKGVSASTELGRRFLYGDGVPADPARALEYFTIAIKDGANGPLAILHQAVLDHVPGLEVAKVKAVIVAALAAGSSKAAEMIASDGMEAPIYGFTADDALYAISLMADIGDRSALLLAVKAYVRGLNGAPDIDRAIPYIEKLAQVDGLEPSAILDLGDDLERLNLPLPLALRFIEPLYRKVTGPGRDEAVFRADRLLAAATEAGATSAAQLGSARVASAITELKDNAARNHARSMILLGDLYYAGIWVPINNRQAVLYYEQALAIEPGDVARERLAKALMLAKTSPFEDQRYRQLVTELADAGSMWGLYRKGVLLIEDGAADAVKTAEGEAILLDLSAKAYPPAVRALLKHLSGVRDDLRIDQAVAAFSSAWTLNKDQRIGRLLGEFYTLAGRLDQARAILSDPLFARDPRAILDLARLEAGANPPDEQRAMELAQQGIAVAANDQASQLDFIAVLQGLNLPEAQAEGQRALVALADADNTDAISALLPAYLSRIETDPAALETVLKWSSKLAGAGAEGPILDLAARYLVKGANPALARSVLEMADHALETLPPESYLRVLVAQAYYFGFGTEKNVEKGNALIEAAAAAGNKDALAELGAQFFYGMGRKRDPGTALIVLDSAAALGSNVARVEVGRLYSSSTGPRVDMLKAYSMFLAAAEDGSTAGMVEVGRLFLAGWGIAKDEEKGVTWLERAAELGNTDAMYQLYFHFLAKNDPESEAIAMSWLNKSSESGVDPARLRLAERLLTEDREAHYEQAMALLDEAYANGYNLAGKYKRAVNAAPRPGSKP
ncbi:MAG TPA: hypothetical protein VG757_15950 [Devosia sp.]|nr:hypothetical protein [Devosia sp.]